MSALRSVPRGMPFWENFHEAIVKRVPLHAYNCFSHVLSPYVYNLFSRVLIPLVYNRFISCIYTQLLERADLWTSLEARSGDRAVITWRRTDYHWQNLRCPELPAHAVWNGVHDGVDPKRVKREGPTHGLQLHRLQPTSMCF